MNTLMTSPFQEGERVQLDISRRLRRLRKSKAVRSLVRETDLRPHHLVQPIFVTEGPTQEIESMPTIFRYQLEDLLEEIEAITSSGVVAINLFCHVLAEKKDPFGSEAYRSSSLLARAIKALKTSFPDLLVIADIALDPFTDHGHDGLIDNEGNVLNDLTCTALGKMALVACEAGADFISPSDMMDGRVGYLRQLLDGHDFTSVGIISYAVKYASSLYSPFRHALDSAPKIGDKKGYQLNPSNSREALYECLLDEEEHADMLLIKPALTSLDIIARLRAQTLLPIGAYQVSGEWAMIHAAAERGWLNQNQVLLETLIAIKRAGADFIFTYGAKQVAQLLSR